MVLLNSTDLIGWDPAFAFADWFGIQNLVWSRGTVGHSLLHYSLSSEHVWRGKQGHFGWEINNYTQNRATFIVAR